MPLVDSMIHPCTAAVQPKPCSHALPCANPHTLGMAVSRSASMRSAFLASASASDSAARASRSASWLAASSASAAWREKRRAGQFRDACGHAF